MLPCGTSFIQGPLPHFRVDISNLTSLIQASWKAAEKFPPISVYFWIHRDHLPSFWKHVLRQRGIFSSLQPFLEQKCCWRWEGAWGSWGTRAQHGQGLPVTTDSVHYFWFSKGRKIRDTNLHTPLRRTIKRAEDILERLQILLCPALSTAGCLQNVLHVLLVYTPVLIYSMTLMSYHRAMTQFGQNFQKSEPAAPLCHLPLLTFVPALLRSWNADDTTPWGFLSSPFPAGLSSIKWQSHQN